MLIQTIKPDFTFTDERGSLTQLVHMGYEQVNVLISKAESFRGGHYHKISTEIFYVVSGRVHLEAKKGDITENYTFSQGDMFEIPPLVVHGMSFDEDCVKVAMYDICVEKADGTKDIYSA
ncbi:MAG: cupin domain-containing protein [Clostridiales bacterium]|jgi:mannose-6-phosphate isomerase-like protein (cupin superfamily)|nr:cupin domain-containing protein [Clostridiales bacterium]